MTVIEKAAELGAMLKDTPEFKRLDEATKKYEEDEKLADKITAYNKMLEALTVKRTSGEENTDGYKLIEGQLENMYDYIMSDPTMAEYTEAKSEADRLMQKVYDEMNFQITGKRACSHDCSTCGGCG